MSKAADNKPKEDAHGAFGRVIQDQITGVLKQQELSETEEDMKTMARLVSILYKELLEQGIENSAALELTLGVVDSYNTGASNYDTEEDAE